MTAEGKPVCAVALYLEALVPIHRLRVVCWLDQLHRGPHEGRVAARTVANQPAMALLRWAR